MPPATIRSLRNGITPIVGASRDDLRSGDVVAVNSVNVHTTYSWSIAYKPPGSAAAFSGSAANQSPGSFVVDVEGPYLVRLIADLGLPTESEQFVRLRYLTVFGDLQLVAAGEQYGGTVNVPVDAAFTGWADEQNYNLRTILGFVARVSASGRVLYVDTNAGTEGYGDHPTIQAAITAASGSATPATPWVVLVRPGTYTEDITFAPNVHVAAWPGTADPQSNVRLVTVRGVHSTNLANIGDRLVVSGISFSVHVAGVTPGITKAGPGSAYLVGCRIGVDVASPTQGPAIRLTTGPLTVTECSVEAVPANPITVFGINQTGGTLTLNRSTVRAPSGILVPGTVPAGVITSLADTRVASTGGVGAWGIRTDAEQTTLEYSTVSGAAGTGVPVVGIHVGAGVLGSAVRFAARWSAIEGEVLFDTTGVVGATELDLSSVVHYGFVFPAATPTRVATVRADTLGYDNTASGLTATDVQAAIDEVVSLIAPFSAGYTLEQAYNGGGPGAGRTIVADSGSVQILDAAFPSDPVPPGNTNGNLEVVGKVSVGALTKPEIDIDPNPYGAGPQVSLGWTVVPNNSPTGVGTATIVARSTESPLYRNYDLRLGTQPASGGGKVGDVVVRAGDGTQGGGATPNAGQVYVIAGSGLDGAAFGGDVALVPGVDFAGVQGSVAIVDPRTATPASVTASGVASDPVGVTGDITFATDMGAVTASILAADTRAAAVAKLDALLGLSAVELAGVITVSSRTTGPTARVYFLSATAGLDAALGTFDGQPMTTGNYPDVITMQATAPNEISLGANGLMGPLIYNADTGKLTVPGIIDPTGLVFYEVAPGTVTTGDGLGGIYVSSEDKSLHFVDSEGNDTPVGSGGGDGASSIVRNKYTATPKNVNDRQQILVYDSFTLDPEGTVVLREGGELVMLGGTASGGGGATAVATDRYSAGFTYIGPRQQILSYEDYTIDLGATTEVAVSGYLVIL